MAGLSPAILFAFAPRRAARPDGRMFFLGARLMLLETKGVVHMALLFGSTWAVSAIVFAAILLSDLLVATFRPRRLRPAYAPLAASLLVNVAAPGLLLARPRPRGPGPRAGAPQPAAGPPPSSAGTGMRT